MKPVFSNRETDDAILKHGAQLLAGLRLVLSHSAEDASHFDEALRNAKVGISEVAPSGEPLPEYFRDILEESLSRLTDDERLSGLLTPLRALLPFLMWSSRKAGAGEDDRFVTRHLHGLVTGSKATLACSSLTLGIAVLQPDCVYPIHQHPPAEFYLVLSDGQWYREDRGWWRPGRGGVVLNPPHCLHAMRSGESPLVAVWGLLTSDASGPDANLNFRY